LTIELQILSDQKISKIIELLEFLRQDTPAMHERGDAVAHAMSTPTDNHAVLEAIKRA
jgi:hypothetical protein